MTVRVNCVCGKRVKFPHVVIAFVLGLVLNGGASIADDRVGLAETCDSIKGWVPGWSQPDDRFRPRSLQSKGGKLIIDTQLGTLGDSTSKDYLAGRNIIFGLSMKF